MSNDNSHERVLLLNYQEDQRRYDDQVDDAEIVRSSRIVWAFFFMLAAFIVWAYFAELSEVSMGTGKVIPTSREQVIQSLEGGILQELHVREGDIVEAGEIIAQLDLTKTEADVGESAARYRAAIASIARLEAEVNQKKLEFPDELDDFPLLKATEQRLYETRQRALKESISSLQSSLRLVREELRITRSLAQSGAASNVDVLKLQREETDLRMKITERESEYMVKAREELGKMKADANALESVIRGRTDSLTRLTLRSPVRGVVKDVEVTTRGGVIPPNGHLMSIVPLDDQLLIEARISPRDVAYIHPGQEAKVKISAYDYAIFGGLEGEVVSISPDTIQDEVKPEVFYYRVFIRTETDSLKSNLGQDYPIVPGMIATVDIKTGSKTVWDYLMKPITKAEEALRER